MLLSPLVLFLSANRERGKIPLVQPRIGSSGYRQCLPKGQLPQDSQSQRFNRFEGSEAVRLIVLELDPTGLLSQPRHRIFEIKTTRASALDDVFEYLAVRLYVLQQGGCEYPGVVSRIAVPQPD